jgi:hypothetical protein
MILRHILVSSVMITSTLFLTACETTHKTADIENTPSPSDNGVSLVDAGYANWHKSVLNSHNVINGNQGKIESSYNSIRNFDKKSITAGWINEISTAMADNDVYRESILEAAADDKLGFAQALLKNPKESIYYQGASDALVAGLKKVENFDYQYRILSNAFEDSARGRARKTPSNAKNIGAVALKQYTSKNNTPSVAEQLLTAAAIKILGFDNNPKLQTAYTKVLSNTPIESCLGNAQRNSAQCKAASYDKNDLSFCMAKHAIGETSQCFSWILP